MLRDLAHTIVMVDFLGSGFSSMVDAVSLLSHAGCRDGLSERALWNASILRNAAMSEKPCRERRPSYSNRKTHAGLLEK